MTLSPDAFGPRKGYRRGNPEQKFQIQVAEYLRYALPPNVVWTAFPAGGGGETRGAFLKAMGLTPGIPDLMVIHPETGRAVWIELKSAGGVLSPAQKVVHTALMKSGCPVTVARSVEHVEGFLRACGFPLRASCDRGQNA